MLKALAILPDTAVRRSAVDQEDLKPYWKSEKILGWCPAGPVLPHGEKVPL